MTNWACPRLQAQDATEKINGSKISPLGRQITGKCVKQYRYDIDDKRVQNLKAIKLFQGLTGPATARDVKSASCVQPDFTQYLLENNDAADVRFFYKKLGLVLDDPAIEQQQRARANDAPQFAVPDGTGRLATAMFKAAPAIKLWRSAEKNAEAYIAALNGVVNVTDVSVANLGYDLEVMLETGRKVYVEVKSVSSFTEPFRLTNNEYSSAIATETIFLSRWLLTATLSNCD